MPGGKQAERRRRAASARRVNLCLLVSFGFAATGILISPALVEAPDPGERVWGTARAMLCVLVALLWAHLADAAAARERAEDAHSHQVMVPAPKASTHRRAWRPGERSLNLGKRAARVLTRSA